MILKNEKICKYIFINSNIVAYKKEINIKRVVTEQEHL